MKEAISRVWSIGSSQAARLPLAGGFEEGETEWSKWSKVFQGLKELEEKFKAEEEG
jgi:2-keto-3-deoxy-L-rhamnonate aldolase